MKKTLMMATGALVAAGFAADAQAVDVELYGQVNKAVVNIDDGDNNETSFVDNDMSATRIGVKGEQQLANGLTASVLLEFESESNSSLDAGASNSFDAETGAQGASGSFTERHSRVGLAGNFGAVFLGRTSTAADGITEIDMAGVTDLMGSDVNAIGGGAIVDTNGNVTLSQATDNFFDESRADVIVYHSPVVNGFQVAVSSDDSTNLEGAVRYSGKYDAYHVKAGLGYKAINDHLGGRTQAGTIPAGNDTDMPASVLAGSISVKHDNGLGATFSYGTQEFDAAGRDEATNLYVKVGYTMDMLELAADYTLSENMAQNNDELTAYGVGAQYNLGDGVSVAAMYRNIEFERQGSTTENDIDILAANLRVKF